MNLNNKEIINKSQFLKRKYPKFNFQKKDRKLFMKEIKKKIPNSYIYFLNNIQITSNGYIRNISYTLIVDFLKFTSLSRFKLVKKIYLILIYIKNIFLYKKIVFKDLKNAIFIHDRHSKNYFHWICDVLPKICIKKKFISKSDLFILPNFKTSFQKQSLKLMGVKNIYQLRNKNSLRVENLKYISELYPSGNPSPDIFIKMRNTILSNFKFKCKNRKIYISRKKSRRRRLIDEIDFEKKLSSYGFEIHCMEEYSFEKQVKICAESKIITGLSGSGLINFIWMCPGSKIIDIRKKNDITVNPFFSISQFLNIQYYYYLCDTQSFLGNTTYSDYKIDIDDFFLKLKKILL
jgi:hypothetical protein